MEQEPFLDSSLVAIIYLGVVAAAFAGILPMIVGMFAEQQGFGAQAGGYIASLELAAQLCGVAVFIVLRSLSWKGLAAAAIVLMTIGNLSSAFAPSLSVVAASRAVVGIGEGVARSLCYAMLSDALQPGRILAVYASAQMLISAAGMFAVPVLATQYGWQGPFLALAVFCASAIWVLRFMPNLGKTQTSRISSSQRFNLRVYLGVFGIFIYFAGQGALWSYLERLGADKLIPTAVTASVLSVSMVAGLAGSLLVGVYAHRVKPMAGLSIGIILSIISIGLLIVGDTSVAYAMGVCIFNFAWTFTFPFQFELIAKADRSGRASAAIPAVDGLALAVGPFVAATLLPLAGVEITPYICLLGVAFGSVFLIPLAIRTIDNVTERKFV